jgi:hypothetical protein
MSVDIYNLIKGDSLEKQSFQKSATMRNYYKNLKKINEYKFEEERKAQELEVKKASDKIDQLLKQAEEDAELFDHIEENLELLPDYELGGDVDPELLEQEANKTELNDSIKDEAELYNQEVDFAGKASKEEADEFWDGLDFGGEKSFSELSDEELDKIEEKETDELLGLNEAEKRLGLNLNASYILSKLEKKGY